jgi:hypothetical protein
LNKGLELVAALPASAHRDGNELDLRTLLGAAWMALKGWQVQEVWDSLHPALALANSLRRNDALLPILWGLFTHVLCRGRVVELQHWVEQAMNAAETYGDADLLMLGHTLAVGAYFWHGDLVRARKRADRLLNLSGEEQHGHLVDVLNHDPKTATLVFSAQSTWMLGYPDQAAQLRADCEAHARKLGHPFDLGWALLESAKVFDYRKEPDELLKCSEEVARLGREHSMSYQVEIGAPWSSGVALIRKGQVAEGMTLAGRGVAVWEGAGGRLNIPIWKSVQAEGMAQLGDLKGALELIDEAVAQIERPGWGERYYYAETLRIRGWLLALNGDPAAAECAYTASLDWARTQQAKSWELRTATTTRACCASKDGAARPTSFWRRSTAGSRKASRRRI